MRYSFFLLVTMLLCEVSLAGRSIGVPYLVRRTQPEYEPAGVAVPQSLGMVLTIMVSVKNVSNVTQNVTVHLAPGSEAYTNTDQCKVCIGMSGSTVTIDSVKGVATAPGFGEKDIKVSIPVPPSELRKFLIFAAYKSDAAYPNRVWSTLFFPSLQIDVKEDVGAVTATASMHTETCPGVKHETCNCNGTAEAKNGGTDAQLNLASPVLEINGGRPF